MTTFLEQFALGNEDAQFQKRFQMCIIKAAKVIQAEDETTLTLPAGVPSLFTKQQLHDARSALAKQILHSPGSYAGIFTQAAVTNGSMTVEATDAEIETEVYACWNALSLPSA